MDNIVSNVGLGQDTKGSIIQFVPSHAIKSSRSFMGVYKRR